MLSRLFLLLLYFCGTRSTDPCSIFKNLTDSTRSVKNILTDFKSDSCDRMLFEDWYRLQDNGNIPTECPPMMRCGSSGPVWLNGTLPTNQNEEFVLKACQVGYSTCCDYDWKVRVKNCGSFNVYRLVPTSVCPGRYCIEGPAAPCHPGWGSETGSEPCIKLNITFTLKPKVIAYIVNPESRNSSLAFDCSIVADRLSRTYLFDIEWFINDVKVTTTKTKIEYHLLKMDGSLYIDDWNKGYKTKIGFHVRCAMRARGYKEAPPTKFQNSDQFYAGPKVYQSDLDVYINEKKEVNIKIKSTVPIACKNSQICSLAVELYSFKHQFVEGSQPYCNTSLLDKDPKPSFCSFDFDGKNWDTYQTNPITLLRDETSRGSYRAIVQLRAISGMDKLWAQVFLPEMKINVFNTGRTRRTCSSKGDPSIHTIDGKSFVSLALGEFILYKHKTKPIQINSIQHKSHTNCAVAILAATDIFIIYGCGSPQKWIIRRNNCNENNQLLEVFERSLGKEFEVVLPSGTRVEIKINGYYGTYLDITISPSLNDWNQVEGKCGTYNDDKYDDFSDRSGTTVSQWDFIKSWSVRPLESLLRAKDRADILQRGYVYCSCVKDNIGHHKTECHRESFPTCQPLNWGQRKCLIKGKREASDDLEIDAPEDIVALVITNATDEWTNGWNETTARKKCESVLRSSKIYELCNSLSSVNNEKIIEACVSDIKISGTELFLDSVKGSLQTECVSELRFNASLWSNNTASESNIADAVFNLDCPNDCSSAGKCIQGLCVCNQSYTGEDCSVNIDKPPVLFDISEESLCDLTKRPCTSMSLFGKGFYQSQKITCRLNQATLSGSTIVPGNTTAIEESGNLENFAEVKCPLTPIRRRRRRRSTNTVHDPDVLLVSVSMNGGTSYSSSVPVLIYDSSCQSCVLLKSAIKCSLRQDVCIVSGKCYDIEHKNCANMDQNNKDVVIQQRQNGLVLIVGGLIGGIFFLTVVVLVAFKLYRHKMIKRVKVIDGYGTPDFSKKPVGKY